MHAVLPLSRVAPAVAPIAAVTLVVFLIGPRAAPALVFMLGLLPLAWLSLPDLAVRLATPPATLVAAIAIAAFSTASLIWSASRLEGAGKVLMLVALAAVVWIAFEGWKLAASDTLERLARAALAALLIGGAFLLLEEVLRHPVKTLVYTYLPFARLPQKHLGLENDEVVRLGGYVTNRNMAALCFLLWPALLAVHLLRPRVEAIVVSALILAAVTITLVHSAHETSLIALLAAAVVLALGWLSPRLALGAVAAGWIAATMLVVPAANLAYARELHLARGMPESARQRIILWGYTAEQVPKRLLTGVGIASTKTLDLGRGELPKPPGFSYPRRTGPHAHNIYLEVWYELGAIGAALLLALGACLLRGVRRLPRLAQPFVLASFTSAAVTGAFTWSLWQTWFMAAFAISLMLNLVAIELARRKEAGVA